jgi:hypothetical protein
MSNKEAEAFLKELRSASNVVLFNPDGTPMAAPVVDPAADPAAEPAQQ